MNQHALSVDHLEGSEAIQSLIEGFERAEDGDGAPTYPVASRSHFLSIRTRQPRQPTPDCCWLATDHNPDRRKRDMTCVVRLASLKMGVLPRGQWRRPRTAQRRGTQPRVGALGRGHRANFIVTHPMEGPQDIAHRFTDAVVDKVFINGGIWEG